MLKFNNREWSYDFFDFMYELMTTTCLMLGTAILVGGANRFAPSTLLNTFDSYWLWGVGFLGIAGIMMLPNVVAEVLGTFCGMVWFNMFGSISLTRLLEKPNTSSYEFVVFIGLGLICANLVVERVRRYRLVT